MIIQFKDLENNVTYLRIVEGYTQSLISKHAHAYYKKQYNENKVDNLSIIEFAIRQQMMVLLTDEEVEELKANEKTFEKSGK